MLQQLEIQNYAIIEKIEIGFSAQLNIITGETGAGKSILMGALSLILGDRADSQVLLNKELKCLVEGRFSTTGNKEVSAFLQANELDEEEELRLRREIATNGKSRAFVNDTPVNLAQLKELGLLLVDLHQQFDTLQMGNLGFQRDVVDALAGNGVLLGEYRQVFQEYLAAKRELTGLEQAQKNANATLDYNQFLYDELEAAALKENELEGLDAELRLLSNAENIKQQLSAIYFELKESEVPIVQQLRSLGNKLHSLDEYHAGITGLHERLRSAQVELQDIADELESIESSVQYDPERIQVVNDKISLGYKLLKKHGVTTTRELIGIQQELQAKLNEVLNLGEAIAQQSKKVQQLVERCQQMAATLSANRHASTKPFTDKVNALLAQVGMPNARLKVQLTTAALNADGSDSIEFLFDANKTNRFEPLARVASGGELSRIMLCIKSLVARKLQLPTLIFDEIDTGISGEAARQVGIIMKELSLGHQLISITHQPQIAARATAHYFVHKVSRGGKVTTSIRLLSEDERINTVAQMLSGEKPTAAAIENAREMLAS